MRFQNQIFYFLCLLSVILSSCDNDERFRVITRQSFVFMEDSAASAELLAFDNLTNDFDKNYHTQFGISETGLSDMDGNENELCLADYLQPSVKYILFKEKMTNFSESSKTETVNHTLTDFIPHKIALGEKYIMALDTIAQKLAFIDKNNNRKTVVYRQIAQKPILVKFFMDRFYVATAEKTLQIWDELAFSLREEMTVKGRVYFITPEDFEKSVALTILYRSNDSVFSANLSLNSNNITKNTLVNYTKVLNSPYPALNYGKEWLGQVKLLKTGILSLTEESTSVEFTNQVSSMDFDFSNSVLFCTQNNTLKVFENLKDSTTYTGFPVTGKIRKVYFKSGYSGNQ